MKGDDDAVRKKYCSFPQQTWLKFQCLKIGTEVIVKNSQLSVPGCTGGLETWHRSLGFPSPDILAQALNSINHMTKDIVKVRKNYTL